LPDLLEEAARLGAGHPRAWPELIKGLIDQVGERPSLLPNLIREATDLGSGHPPGICPCCGQGVDARDLYVSADTNTASRWATEIRLGPQDAEILSMLNAGRPGTIRAEKIMAGLYGRGDWPENPRNVLRVKISRIRRMVASLGVGIEGHYDRGYRLTLSETAVSYA
jgi:DNA-binding response OmpR family regulator